MFILNGLAIHGVGSGFVKSWAALREERVFNEIEACGYRHLTLKPEGDVLIVEVRGEGSTRTLDKDSANDFSDEVAFLAKRKNLEGFSKIILDFKHVNIVNVDIISGLAILRNRLRENLILCGLSEQANEVLNYTYMNKLVNVKSSREEALLALVA